MESVFDKNVNVLSKRYPKIKGELENAARSRLSVSSFYRNEEGGSVLCASLGDKYIRLESAYDSDRLTEIWCKCMDVESRYITLLIFGLGNGMFVRSVLKKMDIQKRYQLIIYEPDFSILYTVFMQEDVSDILDDPCVYLYINGVSDIMFSEALDQAMDLKTLDGTVQIPYPNYPILFPEEYEVFLHEIKMAVERIQATMLVQIRYGEKNYRNFLDNIPNFANSYSLISLREVFPTGFTAIIVSSGPSLSKNIQCLKKARGKCLLLAVDSALPILFREDIQPGIYLCVDANKPDIHFREERTALSAIVTEMVSIPGAIKENQVVFFAATDNGYLRKFLEKEKVELPKLDTGGTVAHTAYSLAEYLGAGTIIFTGQDLAYTGEKAHADHNLSDNNEIRENTVLNTIDIYGNPIRSSREFLIYKEWFEKRIEKNRDKITTIDATEGGALIEGSKLMTLKDAIETYCRTDFQAEEYICQADILFTDEQKQSLSEWMEKIPEELEKMIRDAKKSIQIYEKMYLLAKQNKLSKGEFSRMLKETDRLSQRIDHNPALPFVEYLIQDAIKTLSEETYREEMNIRNELMKASSLGKTHSEAILEKAEWVQKDILKRIADKEFSF